MKKLLLALALALLPQLAYAQCNGIFAANTICGTIAGGIPGQVSTSALTGIPGGTSQQVQINSGVGTFAGITDPNLAARLSPFISTGLTIPLPPQMRLTLVSGLAVPNTDQVGIASFWVTPVGGGMVPIFNGTVFTPTQFAEVTQLNTDTTKSPAAVANNSVYDIFCWVDTGPTNRCTRGPAWTNDTTRSAGTVLVNVSGIWLNSVSITNGPASQRGTYVGSCRSNGTATWDLKFGTSAAGGGQAWFSCWNMYNRAPAQTFVIDSNAAWTVGTAGVEALDAPGTGSGLGNRVSILHGIDEDAVYATIQVRGVSVAAQPLKFGFCLDNTTAFTARSALSYANVANDMFHNGQFSGFVGLGFHFLQACESSAGGANQARMLDTNGGLIATVWW